MSDILQWNLRGLRPQFPELKLIINNLHPSVLCLQETKLPADKANFSVKGYSCFHHINTGNQIACGGSSIFVKNSLFHRQIPLTTDIQSVAVRVTFSKIITICSVYIPPNSNPSLNKFLDLIDQLPKPFLLVGDFNAHSPLWGNTHTDPRGKVIEDLLSKTNVCLLNDNSPTYLNSFSLNPSSLDLSLCSPEIFSDLAWSVLDDQHGSDHFPITIQISIPSKSSFPEKWNFRRADWQTFSSDCEKYLSTDCDISSYEIFYDILLNICYKHIPKTSKKPRKGNVWYTEECQKAVTAKNSAYRRFVRTGRDSDMQLFKIARARARRAVREAKQNSFKHYVSKITPETPMSKVWKMVKKLKGNYSCPTHHVSRPDGSLAETELDIANTIADTLSENSSSQNYNTNFQREKQKTEQNTLNFSTDTDEIYNHPFDIAELKTAISELNNSAEGPDEIHNEIVRHLPETSLLVLLNSFNLIWSTHTFPDSWRQATIIPIPKPGKNHTNPTNYRPIALTSCLCKVMEKLVNKRLMWVLEHNNVLSDFQCGFRKNRSTVDHLVRLETFIREAFSKGEHITGVFFDLEKAFDTTWKYGILRDLHEMGFRGHLPIFVQNFLKNRSFKTKINGTLSDPHLQEEGVPQGSILSPILFEIKINSIVNVLNANSDCSLYVDDLLVLYRTKAKMETVERQLQLQLNRLQGWADKNGFKFSPQKTVVVHFCCARKCIRNPDLYLYKKKIPVKDEVRFLGVIFDKKLSFVPHLKDLRLRCQSALNAVKVLSNPEWGGDSSTLLTLYRSLIRSKLDYASFVYGSARESYIKMLDPIHNSGLRLALGAFRTSPVDSLLAEADELPLHLRRWKLGIQYALKIKSTPENPVFDSIFNITKERKAFFAENPSKIPPFGIRIQPHLDNMELSEDEISPFKLPSSPPWKFSRPVVDLSLSRFTKSDTGAEVFREEFELTKKKYSLSTFIFSDGSKDSLAVGAAACSGESTRQKKLNPCSSIFTSEASALLLALDIVEASSERHFVICSDSLSVLKSLKSFDILNTEILPVLEKINILAQQKTIVFVWIPGHCGIDGNEKADGLAKQATRFEKHSVDPVPHSDLRYVITRGIAIQWNNYWSTLEKNKLREIMPNQAKRPDPAVFKNRKVESIFTRLRIGHSPYTHGYLLRGEPPPWCVGCDRKITIKHILIECVDFNDIRKKYIKTQSLEVLFNVTDPRNVVRFLKEIGLLAKI